MGNNNIISSERGDFTEEELEILSRYIGNGVPGLEKLDESAAFQSFELYMTGKGYSEISKITNLKKEKVLYLAHKGKWHDKKMTYYTELSKKIMDKYQQSKLDSVTTVTSGIAALNKYFEGKFNKYIKNKDDSIIENLDTKLLGQYYKSIETLDKIMGRSASDDGGGATQAPVNININGTSSVTEITEETIDIETDEDAAQILRLMAKNKKKTVEH